MIGLQVAVIFLLCLSVSPKTLLMIIAYFFYHQRKKMQYILYCRELTACSVSGVEEGVTSGRAALGSAVARPRPSQGTRGHRAKVLAKRTQFKSEVSWALKGFVSSPKKHFALPELGLTIGQHILVPRQPQTLPQR